MPDSPCLLSPLTLSALQKFSRAARPQQPTESQRGRNSLLLASLVAPFPTSLGPSAASHSVGLLGVGPLLASRLLRPPGSRLPPRSHVQIASFLGRQPSSSASSGYGLPAATRRRGPRWLPRLPAPTPFACPQVRCAALLLVRLNGDRGIARLNGD